MDKLKKYLTVALSVVFAFTIISPVCCAQDWADLAGHEHKTSTRSHEHDGHAGCDSPLVKNLSKPDNITAVNTQWFFSFDISFENQILEHIPHVLWNYSSPLIFFNKAGPPLYLLHSVFLN